MGSPEQKQNFFDSNFNVTDDKNEELRKYNSIPHEDKIVYSKCMFPEEVKWTKIVLHERSDSKWETKDKNNEIEVPTSMRAEKSGTKAKRNDKHVNSDEEIDDANRNGVATTKIAEAIRERIISPKMNNDELDVCRYELLVSMIEDKTSRSSLEIVQKQNVSETPSVMLSSAAECDEGVTHYASTGLVQVMFELGGGIASKEQK